ncbi:hypothetical protein TDB9533_02722 [Thalassocella blandensis]|nr:hypothetical protein TDB9533_02722 [Thalassocella blandensis]
MLTVTSEPASGSNNTQRSLCVDNDFRYTEGKQCKGGDYSVYKQNYQRFS